MGTISRFLELSIIPRILQKRFRLNAHTNLRSDARVILQVGIYFFVRMGFLFAERCPFFPDNTLLTKKQIDEKDAQLGIEPTTWGRIISDPW